ncbi:hypothetical protein J5J83_03085 [Azoarcus sp. L1K30]|uniref:hypothetical protein n=1 Tax=Azoarcus sp. L1K30 TaxID=2820277 RepID=UPI001B80EA54|nr:hypothetical protein [Azoarcus sp. L1K30]MBR0565100.1 hypothetical protein [Azoarcus sp. L1K30]
MGSTPNKSFQRTVKKRRFFRPLNLVANAISTQGEPMFRWERRLKDLAQILKQCEGNYFEPELFRMNTNQFLQTARTVTFIIQKHKAEIHGFEQWYKSNVVDAWASDELMSWAKDSRNAIEKEGDLDMYSSLSASLFFSYIEEDDLTIPCGHEELIGAGVKRLTRLARRVLPTAVSDGAVVKVERRWVANSLPEWELLHALTYIYVRHFECCRKLAQHLGGVICHTIRNPTDTHGLASESREIVYFKLNSPFAHKLRHTSVKLNRNISDASILKEITKRRRPPTSLDANVELFSEYAQAVFARDGYHIPILFAFDEDWRMVDFVPTKFADHADKYIFFRYIADRAADLRASSIIWVSEAWLRNTENFGTIPIRHLPVVGEGLEVLGMDKDGEIRKVTWMSCPTNFVFQRSRRTIEMAA